MNRTTTVFIFFALLSSFALAEKPFKVPDGASPIGHLPIAANDLPEGLAPGQQPSPLNHFGRQNKALPAAASARASESAKPTTKIDAPKIEPRPVIADPNS